MVAEQLCRPMVTMLAAISAVIPMAGETMELLTDGCPEALNSSQQKEKAVWKATSRDEFDDGVVPNYIFEELYVKRPRGGAGVPAVEETCKATSYLQRKEIAQPNEMSEKACKAVPYMQSNRSVDPKEMDVCKAMPYLQDYEMDEDYGELIKNDLMTLCRSLVEYVIKMIGWWTLATMNKVYVIMSPQWKEVAVALLKVNPALETMLHHVKNNFNYLVDKLNYVMVNFGLVWQSTCLALWWFLTPHSSLRYLHWIGCLSNVVGGQIFHAAVVVLLVSSWLGIMATSNMNPFRHVACQEHMSRIGKRRERRMVNVTKRQFIAMMMICSRTSSAAMEQDAVLQRIIALTEPATRAAMSAESTLNQVQTMTSSSSSSAEGLQAASRILKAPHTFSGDDPVNFASWRFRFTSWLTFGDSRYTTLLEKVETMTTVWTISSYDAPEKELAHKLYAVLTSYLRGRCSHIIKAFTKSRDGFVIWYQLMREFEPMALDRRP